MPANDNNAGNTGSEASPIPDGWENDGGSTPHAPDDEPGRNDQSFPVAQCRILQRLGLAVLIEWNDLPVDVQRKLFKAASEYGASPNVEVTERIARFLHDHKDDIGGL